MNYKNLILIIASLLLYTLAEPIYIFLLLFSILINYYSVILDNKLNRRLFGNIVIVLDALILLSFKYINSFIPLFFHETDSLIKVTFPIGLSFFTFREISFVVEARRNGFQLKHHSLMNVALYISNFATIIAGPISLYNAEFQQLSNRHSDIEDLHNGLLRFACGLIKKILVADSLKIFVDACFSMEQLSVTMAWLGSIAFTLQIYVDFSGYTDMAIGIGRILGFRFPENFNYPYIAHSISDFWKRWHMSLTAWFTHYVYFPLGGSKVKSSIRHIFNLFVVWLCTGMWHGSDWSFIVWGMLYFVLQTIEKKTSLGKVLNHKTIGLIYTLFIVNLCWVIFRATDLTQATNYISTMFCLNNQPLYDEEVLIQLKYYAVPLLFGVLLSFPLSERIHKVIMSKHWIVFSYRALVIVLFMCSLAVIISRGYSAPLYANF